MIDIIETIVYNRSLNRSPYQLVEKDKMLKERCFKKNRKFITIENTETCAGIGEFSDNIDKDFLLNFLKIPVTEKQKRLKYLTDNGFEEVK